MVGKLIKHELRALFRVIVWISVAVLLFACVSRFLLTSNILVSEKTQDIIVLVLIICFYVLSILALVVTAWAVAISRFYRSLFTGEGYLTLALPVTAAQLIWAKLLSALIAMIYAAAISFGSLFILFSGMGTADAVGEVIRALWEIVRELYGGSPLHIAEKAIETVVLLPMSLLSVYAVISLGQLFTSHRVGMIFLLFVCLYIAVSVLGALLTPLERYLLGLADGHVLAWVRIVLFAAVDVGCYFLIRYILRNKVNLIA